MIALSISPVSAHSPQLLSPTEALGLNMKQTQTMFTMFVLTRTASSLLLSLSVLSESKLLRRSRNSSATSPSSQLLLKKTTVKLSLLKKALPFAMKLSRRSTRSSVPVSLQSLKALRSFSIISSSMQRDTTSTPLVDINMIKSLLSATESAASF